MWHKGESNDCKYIGQKMSNIAIFENEWFAHLSISMQPPVKPKVRVPKQKVTGQAGNRVQLECMVGRILVVMMMIDDSGEDNGNDDSGEDDDQGARK